MFSEVDVFPNLTELILGGEACNTILQVSGPDGRDVSHALFKNIGKACPNLRVFDVSAAPCLKTETLLFLFFHDAYHTLHKGLARPNLRDETGRGGRRLPSVLSCVGVRPP